MDLQTGLAAESSLHDVCVWRNQRFGRPNLTFTDRLDR
jgi:hypothetical protein